MTEQTSEPARWRMVHAMPRLMVMIAVVAVVAGGLLVRVRWTEALLTGWIVGALVFVVWAWASLWPLTGDQTREHATQEDLSPVASDSLLIGVNLASLGAVAMVILDSAGADPGARIRLGVLALAGVAISWTLVQTLFTVHYARLYYRDPAGGVEFVGSQLPDYHDFAYLAFTMGMTFQVSDTNLNTGTFRRAVLRHGLLSYVFSTVILATTINLVVGLSAA